MPNNPLTKLFLLALLVSTAFSVERHDRPDIDPIFQGAWHGLAASPDKGKTITPINKVVCTVTSFTVIFEGGETCKVSRIVADTDANGCNSNLIIFSNTKLVLSVAETTVKDIYMVQMFAWSAGKFDEEGRIIFKMTSP